MKRRFEWDPDKARGNLQKHGIGFETARSVFADPYHYSVCDDAAHGEQRWRTTGRSAEFTFVLVAHTLSELGDQGEPVEIVRIISARRATKQERRQYEGRRGSWL